MNDEVRGSDERFSIAGSNFAAKRVTANEGLGECQQHARQGDAKDLYCPQSGQRPPEPSFKWTTIPEGTTLRQPANNEQQTLVNLADHSCQIIKRQEPITIARVPTDRPPTEEEKQIFKKYWAQIDEAAANEQREKAERGSWGFPETGSEGVFTFQQVLDGQCEWCSFRIKHRLVKFCERNGYPFTESEEITQVGFAKRGLAPRLHCRLSDHVPRR
jgi:hypothetical protein